MEKNNIVVSYFNANKKYVKGYEKFFKNASLKCIDKELEEMDENTSLSSDNALYNDYLKFRYLYENGGLLIDGDFLFINSLDNFYTNDFFISFSDVVNISTNLIYVRNKENSLVKQVLDCIESNEYTSITDIFSSITNKDLKHNFNSLVKFGENNLIYPYDYFYPIDYEKDGKTFSTNTKAMYFSKNAKVPSKVKSKMKVLRKVGASSYKYFLSMLSNARNTVGYKKYILTQDIKKHFSVKADPNISTTLSVLDEYIARKKSGENIDYVIIHNPRWLGVTSATKELFTNLLPLEEVYIDSNAEKIADKITELGVSQVIFSAFDYGWDKLARKLKEKNSNIKIKSFWHGSHSQVIEKINWETNVMVINLHKEGIIDVMGTCKESLVNFYKVQGYTTAFIQNTVNFTDEIKEKVNSAKKKDNGKVNVGLYSAGTDWRKNTYNQVMATSLFNDAVLELVPLRYEVMVTAAKNGLRTIGSTTHIARDELLVKMAENDINIYVTFSECAPMLPIESMEAGTVCLTGNNHHYFNGTKLYDYLVVEREDDVMAIYDKMKYALEHRDEILALYKEWKENYDKEARKSVEDFLKM